MLIGGPGVGKKTIQEAFLNS